MGRPVDGKTVWCQSCHPRIRSTWVAKDLGVGLTDSNLDWTGNVAHHRECGKPVTIEVGGWAVPFRATCQGCGDPLTGRQSKWCSRSGLGYEKICAMAWNNPSHLWAGLARRQELLCGICCLPLAETYVDRWGRQEIRHLGGWRETPEVDHVEPLSRGGARILDNLAATHGACNQMKKARTLTDARDRMDITAEMIAERIVDISEDARRWLYPEQALPASQVPLW